MTLSTSVLHRLFVTSRPSVRDSFYVSPAPAVRDFDSTSALQGLLVDSIFYVSCAQLLVAHLASVQKLWFHSRNPHCALALLALYITLTTLFSCLQPSEAQLPQLRLLKIRSAVGGVPAYKLLKVKHRRLRLLQAPISAHCQRFVKSREHARRSQSDYAIGGKC